MNWLSLLLVMLVPLVCYAPVWWKHRSRYQKLRDRTRFLNDQRQRAGKTVLTTSSSLVHWWRVSGVQRNEIRWFVLGVIACLFLCLGLSLSVLAYPPVILCGVVGVWYARRYYRLRRARAQFTDIFPEAVDHLTRAVQAGVPIERAMAAIAGTFKGELGFRFQRLVSELELGVPFRRAMENLAVDLHIPDVSFFCATLVLNRDSGGPIAHILLALGKTLRDRRAAARRLHTLTAEARSSAKIVAALPFVGIALQAWLNPHQLQFLIDDALGRNILAYAGISISVGLIVIWRMARF